MQVLKKYFQLYSLSEKGKTNLKLLANKSLFNILKLQKGYK